jgi:NADH-quinone oxidoreductase subunit M
MGPVVNNEHLSLGDAGWNERLAAGLLILGIVVIGIAPFHIKRPDKSRNKYYN